MEITCPSCGLEVSESFTFCPGCGGRLDRSRARSITEERKVVTCLFCDLVGFTASSEAADPEDVDQMLNRYAAMARTVIESHGGVVEKFIGDAVVGIFGVPAAHEDDPERAVRAALRIVEEAEDLQAFGGESMRLRVGINTGEALVRLGVLPGSGERMLSGDAVNTASRLQSVAPEMGVAVGLATYEATAMVFDYAELEAAPLKGKAEPVRVFHPRAARARFGTDLTRTNDSPFVGREIDLALLKGIFDKVVASGAPHMVTVVGEPGLGKSRIVAELGAYVDSRPELITWRQGRCLPYGEGITFWALGEIIKAHAGILESDPAEVVATRLSAVLPDGDDKAWFAQRLLPLVGIEASSAAEREEQFTAWRRYLEQIAEDRPAVLVFEDLHWADEAMLAFLEHLADRAEGVPLLVVGTARPELFDRHPGYLNGLRTISTVTLSPLTDDETARLVSALLSTTVLPAELQRPILDRAEGNPLYAEEFVRLLKDRDLLERQGSSWALRPGAEVPFPDTVQALIAARLDTLAPQAKAVLAHAAVVGKVFWAGAVAEMGHRDLDQVTDTLRELSRKQLVRPARRSSIEGETEYAFCHVLCRDVAYRQLPRQSRSERHLAAARWIEATAPGRVEDVADVLAHHYATALELARAAGQAQRAAELEGPALHFLTLAGERASGLDTHAALASFDRALALTPPGHPQRPAALARYGEALGQSGDLAAAERALEQAIPLLLAQPDVASAARAMGRLSLVRFQRGGQWNELPVEALRLLEPLGPSEDLVGALTEVARAEVLQGRNEAAVQYADQALTLSARLDLPRPARPLGYRGFARCALGDRAGLDDLREAIVLATEAGQGQEVALLNNNLATLLAVFDGPEATLELTRSGIAFARARGLRENVDWMTVGQLDPLVALGRHDEALELVADMEPVTAGSGAGLALLWLRAHRALILALRGETPITGPMLEWLESTSRASGGTDAVILGLAAAAAARERLGDAGTAAARLVEIAETPGTDGNQLLTSLLPTMVRTALAVDRPDVAARLAEAVAPRDPHAEHSLAAARAALDETRGELAAAATAYADAAGRWQRFGVLPELAFALLGQGRCLLRLGRPDEATPPLLQARDHLERLRAGPALTECDVLLQRATALSS